MEKVSIVIPVYNAEKYLVECIDSALNQTYNEVEIIAVNDGSTDNSLNILKKYSDKIRIISKENGGTASALNIGIKNMNGEWFKWLSADDVLYPNAIEDLVSFTKELPNKKFILCSDYEWIDANGKIINKVIESRFNKLSPFDLNVVLLDHHIGNGITSMIHKSTIEECGIFDTAIGYHEDYEFWLRYCLLLNCRMYFIPKVLAKYRVHQDAISWTSTKNTIDKKKKIRKLILGKLDPDERRKYELALVNYQKTKSLMSKLFIYLGYNIIPYLPKSLSVKIVTFYWRFKEKHGNY